MSRKLGKVLVTGAAGFIGSHLTEALLNEADSVRAFVHYNSLGSRGWLDTISPSAQSEIDIFLGDIRDPNGVRTAMRDCDTVLHLAALIAIPFSYHSPDTYVDTNVRGTLNIVQAARDLGVGRVVHTSTSEVYGTAQFVPISEVHPFSGQSPYSASKIGADQIALSFERSFQTPVTIIRPFNTYGPRQSSRAVIPTIITQIAAGKRNLHLGSVHPTRDFSFVADTVSGFLALATADGVVGEVVNIGSNFEISIGDTVNLIADAMSAQVEVSTDDQRIRPERSEVERLWADNSKAKQLTGWTPTFGGLDGFRRGIETTVQWFSSPRNMAAYRPNSYSI